MVSKTYTEFKTDSEKFSLALEAIGEKNAHVAILGATSYEWVVAYMGTVIMSVRPIHHAYCLSMDILKRLSIGCVICINDSLMRIAKNIKLFEPNMILMVPLMIETLAKKLEAAALLPAPVVKAKVFGKQFHTICSGGAYMNPAYIDTFKKYGITILQGYYHMPKETAETLEDGWLKTYRPRKLRISFLKSALLKRCLFVRAKVSSKQKSFLITNMLPRKKLRISEVICRTFWTNTI